MSQANLSSQRRIALTYTLAALISLIGLGDSIYLTVQHLTGKSVKCSVTSTCSKVLSSRYASISGIPTAAFGAAAYFGAFSLAVLAAFGSSPARRLFAALAAAMFAVTLWLLYLQSFVLKAYCEYCLLSAAITTLLTLIAIWARIYASSGEITEQTK